RALRPVAARPGAGAVNYAPTPHCRLKARTQLPAAIAPRLALLLDLLEISQIRWRLVLLGGHQVAVAAEEVAFLADFDVTIALRPNFLDPLRLLDRYTRIFLCHYPRPRQRVVDRRDFVVEDARICLVGVNPLLEDTLIVGVEWKAGRIVRSRTFQP